MDGVAIWLGLSVTGTTQSFLRDYMSILSCLCHNSSTPTPLIHMVPWLRAYCTPGLGTISVDPPSSLGSIKLLSNLHKIT